MRRNASMRRTFWPATCLDDLPVARSVNTRLSAWLVEWFGENARVLDTQIRASQDFAPGTVLSLDGSVVAAVNLHSDLELRLASQSLLPTLNEAAIQSYALDIAVDLCVSVFGSEHAPNAVAGDATTAQMPDDVLAIVVGIDDGSNAALELFVSADIVLETVPSGKALRDVRPDRRHVLSKVPVGLSVERSVSLTAAEVVGLAIDDFIPIAKIGDVAFEMVVSGNPFGVGYVGHIEDKLAIVVES